MKTSFLLTLVGLASFILLCCTSCAPVTEESKLRQARKQGLDRLMVEECGRFVIVPSKGLAVDTALIDHATRWKQSVYKLNSDSTRYIMCK